MIVTVFYFERLETKIEILFLKKNAFFKNRERKCQGIIVKNDVVSMIKTVTKITAFLVLGRMWSC